MGWGAGEWGRGGRGLRGWVASVVLVGREGWGGGWEGRGRDGN